MCTDKIAGQCSLHTFLRLTNMVNSLKHIAVWTIFILSYGHLAAEAGIEARLADLEELAAKVELSVHTNTAQLDKLDFRVHELQDGTRLEGEKIRRVADPSIGFDARVHIHAAAIHLHDHQTVRFNHVLINQAKGYNRTTGRFTCPQHGIYQFSSTLSSNTGGRTVDCEMVMNNIQVGRLRANGPGFDQASRVLVLECMAGRQVWIQHLNGANDTGLLAGFHETSSFSGHLISLL